MAAGSNHLTDMAKGNPNAKRRCIFWRTEDYDDERILKHVRQANPHAQMPIITDLLNQKLPPSRQRTVDSVSSKWKKLKSTGPEDKSFASSSSNEEVDEELLSQIDNYVCSKTPGVRRARSRSIDQLVGMRYHLPREWIAADMIPTGTDQMLWVNGYSASAAEMATMATKAACGVLFCSEWS